jgi:hypothetical protein
MKLNKSHGIDGLTVNGSSFLNKRVSTLVLWEKESCLSSWHLFKIKTIKYFILSQNVLYQNLSTKIKPVILKINL